MNYLITVMLLISFLMISGCGMAMHSGFPAEEARARKTAQSWIGEEFVEFMKTNPDIQRQIDDGKGGEIYQVKFKSGIPYSTWYSSGSADKNYYAIFQTTYFVNEKGIIYDAVFLTDYDGPIKDAWIPSEQAKAADLTNKSSSAKKETKKKETKKTTLPRKFGQPKR